jgi:hypothetical protein
MENYLPAEAKEGDDSDNDSTTIEESFKSGATTDDKQ